MKIGIYSPITPVSSKISSHRSGWPRMLAAQLQFAGEDAEVFFGDRPTNDDVKNFDAILIYHGHEFKHDSKALNYFLKSPDSYDKLASRMEDLIQVVRSGKFYSVDGPMPLYGSMAKARVRDESTDRFKNLPFDELDARIQKANKDERFWLQTTQRARHVVIGDSHATSVWTPGAVVCRNDFKTLNGALKIGLNTYLAPYRNDNLDIVTLYFGNIDVRHHFTRLGEDAVKDTVKEYIRQAEQLGVSKIEIIEMMPIEPESRVLPQSGYYKGQPFWGSWDDRERLRRLANDLLALACEARGWAFYRWPASYVDGDGKLLESVMEKPRSVHLSPEFYAWVR